MSFNLIKCSSYLKETEKKTSDFLTKFIETYLFYMLVVLHFTNHSSSFHYSYIAAEVPFQFIEKRTLYDFDLSC